MRWKPVALLLVCVVGVWLYLSHANRDAARNWEALRPSVEGTR